MLGYLTYLNFQIFYGCCGFSLIVPCLFLKLDIMSNHLLNIYHPICFLRDLVLLKLMLKLPIRLILLVVLVLQRTLFQNIPLLIFLGKAWMIFPFWIVGVRKRVVLLEIINFFYMLKVCNITHGKIRTSAKFTTNCRSLLDLSYLFSTYI